MNNLQTTNKYVPGKSNDRLWFAFFHETCHIIKHSHGELYVEGHGLEDEKENEANAFAQDMLKLGKEP